MNENFCQVNNAIENLEEIKDNLLFIICRPYRENYYYYSINNVENYKLINKYELKKIISFLDAKDINQLEILVNRFRAFIYLHENNSLKELTLNEDEHVEQILKEKLVIDNINTENKNKDTKNKYEKIFEEIKSKLKKKDIHRFS
jgi:hypothetical protein